MFTRSQALYNLLEYNAPIEQLIDAVRMFKWDVDTSYAILTKKHLEDIFLRYLRNEITSNQLELWANAIEGREDIEYEIGYVAAIEEAIFHLANPLLTYPISHESVRSLAQSLSQ